MDKAGQGDYKLPRDAEIFKGPVHQGTSNYQSTLTKYLESTAEQEVQFSDPGKWLRSNVMSSGGAVHSVDLSPGVLKP